MYKRRCRQIFSLLADYVVEIDGQVVTDCLEMNNYFYDFDNWKITGKDGTLASKKHLKSEIKRIKDIETNWNTVMLNGKGRKVSNVIQQVLPASLAMKYPDYIPQPIRNDYEEACAIVNLSPKASATLARRCLQGMIHDFWGIKLKTLNQEITALKDKLPIDLWDSIDALREIGNIGAHTEKSTNVIVDIDPNEAQTLLI